MALIAPERSKHSVIWSLKEPEHIMDADETVRFFRAFGYTINEHFFWLELRHNPGDFRIQRFDGDGRMTVGRALDLIGSRHSWIQKYRVPQNEEFTVLWIADKLETNPVDVMRIFQTSSEVMASRNNETGAYYVHKPDLTTIRSMLIPVPESQRPVSADSDPAGADGTEREATAGNSGQTSDIGESQPEEVDDSDQPPPYDYDPTEREFPDEEVINIDNPDDVESVETPGYLLGPFASLGGVVDVSYQIVWLCLQSIDFIDFDVGLEEKVRGLISQHRRD